MKSKINSDVNLASQTHQVPQVGFPHIEPVKSVARVKQAPIGAHERAMISDNLCLYTKDIKLHPAIIE